MQANIFSQGQNDYHSKNPLYFLVQIFVIVALCESELSKITKKLHYKWIILDKVVLSFQILTYHELLSTVDGLQRLTHMWPKKQEV